MCFPMIHVRPELSSPRLRIHSHEINNLLLISTRPGLLKTPELNILILSFPDSACLDYVKSPTSASVLNIALIHFKMPPICENSAG